MILFRFQAVLDNNFLSFSYEYVCVPTQGFFFLHSVLNPSDRHHDQGLGVWRRENLVTDCWGWPWLRCKWATQGEKHLHKIPESISMQLLQCVWCTVPVERQGKIRTGVFESVYWTVYQGVQSSTSTTTMESCRHRNNGDGIHDMARQTAAPGAGATSDGYSVQACL